MVLFAHRFRYINISSVLVSHLFRSYGRQRWSDMTRTGVWIRFYAVTNAPLSAVISVQQIFSPSSWTTWSIRRTSADNFGNFSSVLYLMLLSQVVQTFFHFGVLKKKLRLLLKSIQWELFFCMFFRPHLTSQESHWVSSMCALLHLKFPLNTPYH